MVDHQIAHIYIPNNNDIEEVKTVLDIEGIKKIHTNKDFLNKERAGNLILEAESDCWFAYPWWDKTGEAPDYATHIDIHNKPGYDPCELFMALWPPMSISLDTSKIHGSHGASGKKVIWASSFKMNKINSIIEGAEYLKQSLKPK